MTSAREDRFHSFDEREIAAAMEAAREPFEGQDLRAMTEVSVADRGELEIRATCLTIATSNRRVCLNLPLNIGRVCIPLPFDPPDGSVQACLSIRSWFGIPTGVCVRILVGGQEVVRKCLP